MSEAAYDLREIARSALGDMPEGKRAAFLAEMLIEIRGPQALEHLSKARTAVNLRVQELIDEKFQMYDAGPIYSGGHDFHLTLPEEVRRPRFDISKMVSTGLRGSSRRGS